MTAFGELFDGIAPGTSEKLVRASRRRRLDAGAVLFSAGERVRVMYLIRAGRVKVWRPARDGTALTLYYLGDGDAPGLVAVCRDAPTPVTMTAATEIDLEYWSADFVRNLLEEDPRFTRNGMRIVAAALDNLIARLEDAATADAPSRIGRALLRLAGEHSTWTGDRDVTIDVTRQDVADLSGSTLHTASRVLSSWDKRGLTESSRGRIIIRKLDQLAAMSDM